MTIYPTSSLLPRETLEERAERLLPDLEPRAFRHVLELASIQLDVDQQNGRRPLQTKALEDACIAAAAEPDYCDGLLGTSEVRRCVIGAALLDGRRSMIEALKLAQAIES